MIIAHPHKRQAKQDKPQDCDILQQTRLSSTTDDGPFKEKIWFHLNLVIIQVRVIQSQLQKNKTTMKATTAVARNTLCGKSLLRFLPGLAPHQNKEQQVVLKCPKEGDEETTRGSIIGAQKQKEIENIRFQGFAEKLGFPNCVPWFETHKTKEKTQQTNDGEIQWFLHLGF